MPALVPYHTVDQVLQAFRERDIWLFFFLFLIGGLYWVTDSALRSYEEYHRRNPGAKAMYDAWQRDHAMKRNANRPTSVICPIHKVFRDTCPPGSHDEDRR